MSIYEDITRAWLEKSGHQVLSSGWPDFMVKTSKGNYFAIEIKGPGDQVRSNQVAMHRVLVEAGIQVLIVSVDRNQKGGFIQPATPFEVLDKFFVKCIDVSVRHKESGCFCKGSIQRHPGWKRRIGRTNGMRFSFDLKMEG